MGDLQKAPQLLKENNAPETLLRYLKLSNPKDRHDIITDTSIIEDVLAPENIPTAKWPSPKGHELVLSQKTTLLRDVVAAIVHQRAEKMAIFDNPELAFTRDVPLQLKDSTVHLYSLHDILKGYEVVIASSNNKAAENISAALPGKDTIDTTLELTYFKTISDALSQKGAET